jgi:hypothetical protein
MIEKPSENEEEYFTRQEMETKRRLAADHQARIQQEERARARELHFMKCPKCGMQLEEILAGEVRIDKCFHCQGLWLDEGELERVSRKEPGFMGRLVAALRP